MSPTTPPPMATAAPTSPPTSNPTTTAAPPTPINARSEPRSVRGDGRTRGPIQFGSPTAQFFRDSVMAPFFALHLKDGPALSIPEALVFARASRGPGCAQ